MNLNQLEKRAFAQAILNTYDLTKVSINKERALKELIVDLEEEFEELNLDVTKNARLTHFNVKSAVANDYSEKMMKLTEGRSIIHGIRNKGGNPKLPFIQIVSNFSITSKEMALSIYDQIKDEYNIFNPLFINFYSSSNIEVDVSGLIVMASKTKKILEQRPWLQEDQISFTDIKDSSYYQWYKDGYNEFHNEVPTLKNKVPCNSEESMEDSLEQGLLKFVEFDGVRIRFISAEKSDLLSHSGIYFNEIFILRKWKGKSLAKQIQRKFISLFANNVEYVWGTIDSENIPSYKTAYSNNRRPIRYECFIKC